MNIKQLCERIRLHPDAQRIIQEYDLSDSAFTMHKQHFYHDRDAFFATVKQLENYQKFFLYFFVRMAVDAYEEYQLRGIDDAIYDDTFADIRIWCEECKRAYGEYGMEEIHWLQEHVQLRLFRLGRLQFQPIALDRDLKVKGRKIAKHHIVLNVHIPAGEKLDFNACEESIYAAKLFFRGIDPIFICHSWLLDPSLTEILSPDSNILRFQQLFDIYDKDHYSREAEQRIFNKISTDPSEYEETTSLQRSAKAYLMAGNSFGSGYGIHMNF